MKAINTPLNTFRMLVYWLLVECAGLFAFYRRHQNHSAPKKLALMSFCLPPQFNSGTHRPLSFIKYANDNGWEINSLTNTSNKPVTEAGKQLYWELPSGSIITPFVDNFKPTSWSFTPKLDGGFTSALALTLSAMKLFKQAPPNAIIASAPPFCYAVAGMWLSRMFNIPLVLDYRDEWTLCPFDFVSKTRFDHWFEKRCVSQANKIIYTTQSHLLAHQKYFAITPSKQALIYNGWEDNGEKIEAAEVDNKKNEIRISYIGRLSGHVDLAPFIETMDRAIKQNPVLTSPIRVEFIGEKTAPLETQLNNYIQNNELAFTIISTAQVSKAEALNRMQSSDYLLMLCNEELSTYIPGKLYDYLSRKVPIIAYGYQGEVTEILNELNAGRFVYDQDEEQLAMALIEPTPDLFANPKLDDWLQNRTRKNQAKQMFALLNSLN
jgi:glycosyltransferase involved in cell wall biosynthesis